MSDLILDIDISINDQRWSDALPLIESYTKDIAVKVLSDYLNNFETAELSIVLADDKFIQELNKNYRNKDKPTNVLSFPMTTLEELEQNTVQAIPVCALGDIIISYETMVKEAEQQNKLLKHHYAHMLIHGCLHLLHYDHQDDKEAATMETEEIKNLQLFDIKNPYETI